MIQGWYVDKPMSIQERRRKRKDNRELLLGVEVATKRSPVSVTYETPKEIILGRPRRVNSAEAERLNFNPITLKEQKAVNKLPSDKEIVYLRLRCFFFQTALSSYPYKIGQYRALLKKNVQPGLNCSEN